MFFPPARLNYQSFATEEEEQAALIYNYCPIFTASVYSGSFQQCYLFEWPPEARLDQDNIMWR